MKKILVILFVVTMLCGCKKEEKTTVCRGIEENTVIVNTIKYIDDRVTSVSCENTLVVDESLIDYITNYLSQYKTSVEHIEGMTYGFTIEENTVVETTTINYEIADMDQLVSEGFIVLSESGDKAYIGYALTINQMIAAGYECTEE